MTKRYRRDKWRYVSALRTGERPRRGLPRDFPPFTTVQYRFYHKRNQGWWPWNNALPLAQSRTPEVCDPEPPGLAIDSQSARTNGRGGPCGFDAATKVKRA